MKVYFDHAATTPLRPKVLEKMLPFLKEDFGNASSIHSAGKNARVAIEEARETVANFINADPGEIYFTSGGTEANNFAVRGIAHAEFKESKRKKLVSSKLEHSCVKDSIKELGFEGYTIEYLSPLSDGTSSLEGCENLSAEDTSFVTAIHTNNETGAVNNISLLTTKLNGKNIFIHTDAVQAFGKTKIDVRELGVHSLTGSAHKINGPKGTGFAYIKSGTPVSPLIWGGFQERHRRGGTENVSGIAGFAEAVRIAQSEMENNRIIVSELKEIMITGLKLIDPHGIIINSPVNSSPYILSITFDSTLYKNDAESMLMYLDINGVAVSNGAACSSGTLKPSHVILGMGKTPEDAAGTIRFSFSQLNNRDEVAYALEVLKRMSDKFRK